MENSIKDYCLEIAKSAILSHLWVWKILEKKYVQLDIFQSCFVTLHKNWQLRWCIWHLKPYQSLYNDLLKNSISCAFFDYRFPQLKLEEINTNDIHLSISFLSELEPIKFESKDELLMFLLKNKPWFYLEYEFKTSTFLPSVWDQLENPIDFLNHLLLKWWIDKDLIEKNIEKFNFYYYSCNEYWKNRNDIDFI